MTIFIYYVEHSHQEIPGSNPGQVSALTCWPNGKAPDYGASTFCHFAEV
jgi:hypothetical protein